jgi:hypothetical protein
MMTRWRLPAAVLVLLAGCVLAISMMSSAEQRAAQWVVVAPEPEHRTAPRKPEPCAVHAVRPNPNWQLHLEDRLPPVPGRREPSCGEVARDIIAQHEIDPPQPPPQIPAGALYDAFTMNGSMDTPKPWYFYERYNGASALKSQWTREVVQEQIDATFNRCPSMGNYPGSCLDITAAIEAFPIRNQTGIVVGSESPWLEGILLAHGARHITTIEYGKIFNEDPRITTMHPMATAALLLEGRFEKADFVFTFSTLEHIGLGRYVARAALKVVYY